MRGRNELTGYNRVFALIEYETSEMDYFSPQASPFLKNLLKKYHDKGINLVSLYSDEMHIQQDWYYFTHHENGQFNLRYLTPIFRKLIIRNSVRNLKINTCFILFMGPPCSVFLPDRSGISSM